MTGPTTRDEVWSEALELAITQTNFETTDVLEAAGLEESKRRTTRRTLHAMRELGWVESFWPGSLAVSTWGAGERLDRLDREAEDEEPWGRIDVDVQSTPSTRSGAGVDELSLPGQGETLARRRDAVRAVYDRIREAGRASKRDLLELVDPENVGYQSRQSAWSNCVHPALQELDGIEATGAGGEWVVRD